MEPVEKPTQSDVPQPTQPAAQPKQPVAPNAGEVGESASKKQRVGSPGPKGKAPGKAPGTPAAKPPVTPKKSQSVTTAKPPVLTRSCLGACPIGSFKDRTAPPAHSMGTPPPGAYRYYIFRKRIFRRPTKNPAH